MFDVWGFDAVTVNPWGGIDTVEPWLNRLDRGVLVWCRGSNPGASDLQELRVDGGEPVYIRLARDLAHLPSSENIGLVVGAAAQEQLTWVRDIFPHTPLLIPGVGAQGADLESCVRNGVDASGRMAVINSGRAIIYASSGQDYAEAAREARRQDCATTSTLCWRIWESVGVRQEPVLPNPKWSAKIELLVDLADNTAKDSPLRIPVGASAASACHHNDCVTDSHFREFHSSNQVIFTAMLSGKDSRGKLRSTGNTRNHL